MIRKQAGLKKKQKFAKDKYKKIYELNFFFELILITFFIFLSIYLIKKTEKKRKKIKYHLSHNQGINYYSFFMFFT